MNKNIIALLIGWLRIRTLSIKCSSRASIYRTGGAKPSREQLNKVIKCI